MAEKYHDDFVASIQPPIPEMHKREKVELTVAEKPGNLIMEPISEADYNNKLKNASYGRRLRENHD